MSNDLPDRFGRIFLADGRALECLLLAEITHDIYEIGADHVSLSGLEHFSYFARLPVDDGRWSPTDILQKLDLHRGVRAVIVDLAETLTSQVAGPDRGTAGDIVSAHHGLLAVIQEEFDLGHIAGAVDDVYDLSSADRALARLACHVDDLGTNSHDMIIQPDYRAS